MSSQVSVYVQIDTLIQLTMEYHAVNQEIQKEADTVYVQRNEHDTNYISGGINTNWGSCIHKTFEAFEQAKKLTLSDELPKFYEVTETIKTAINSQYKQYSEASCNPDMDKSRNELRDKEIGRIKKINRYAELRFLLCQYTSKFDEKSITVHDGRTFLLPQPPVPKQVWRIGYDGHMCQCDSKSN